MSLMTGASTKQLLALWLAATLVTLVVPSANAQPWHPIGLQTLDAYIAERTVLIRMTCTPDVTLIGANDVGLIQADPRRRWASGVVINPNGTIVTARHTLDLIMEREEHNPAGVGSYALHCNDQDVQIAIYKSDNLLAAEQDLQSGGRLARPNFVEITEARTRSATADVLFLQADLKGPQLPPFACAAHNAPASSEAYEDLPISVGGIVIIGNTNFEWRNLQHGTATPTLGVGAAGRFLRMDNVELEHGMSGGAVLDERGRIVGIAVSKTDIGNAQDDHFEPLFDFDELFFSLADNEGCSADPALHMFGELELRLGGGVDLDNGRVLAETLGADTTGIDLLFAKVGDVPTLAAPIQLTDPSEVSRRFSGCSDALKAENRTIVLGSLRQGHFICLLTNETRVSELFIEKISDGNDRIWIRFATW